MKLAIKAAFLVMALLALSRSGQAQCQINASPNYAVSNSFALNDAGTDVLQTVIVDGTTYMSMTSSGYCPDSVIQQFNQNVGNILHYMSVTNQIGSVGGTQSSGGVCGVCWETFQTTTDSGPLQPGQAVSASFGGSVDCSVAGLIFFEPPIIYNVHIGITNFSYLYNDKVNCYYKQYCPNGDNNASCPAPGGLVYPDGMLETPPCNLIPYGATYHLVVNYQCSRIGVTSFHGYSVPCQ